MIVLINPPNPPGKISNKDMMGGLGQLYEKGASLVPPIDIPYTAACLRKHDIPVTVIDCLGLNYDTDKLVDALQDTVSAGQCAYLALRSSLPTCDYDLTVAAVLKRHFRLPVLLFGPHGTMYTERILETSSVDAVVLGEPENAIPEICRSGLENAAGICFRGADGRVIRREPAAPWMNLDEMPHPAWDLMPHDRYFLSGRQFPENGPFLPVLSSRGCPFACHYCPYPVFQGRRWRSRSAKSVLDELQYIVKDLGIRNVLFRDPEFSLDRERVLEICQGIRRTGLKFHWRCETRADTLDAGLIAEFGNAGCIGINIGVETCSEEVAKDSGRRIISIAHIKDVVDQCRSAGIGVFCFFILGLPGQDRSEIFRMIDLAVDLDPDDVQFTYATPYPGTQLHAWAVENGYITDGHFAHYTGYDPVMRNDYLSETMLRQLMRYARHAAHMRPRLQRQRVQQQGKLQRLRELPKSMFVRAEKTILKLI